MLTPNDHNRSILYGLFHWPLLPLPPSSLSLLFPKYWWDTSLLWPARWWTPGLSSWLHSKCPLDCFSWLLRKTDSSESWSLKEWLGTHKCSTWLKWVNFEMGLDGREESTSLRMEPLEAALSQILSLSHVLK